MRYNYNPYLLLCFTISSVGYNTNGRANLGGVARVVARGRGRVARRAVTGH
jgi:hypothetical protein